MAAIPPPPSPISRATDHDRTTLAFSSPSVRKRCDSTTTCSSSASSSSSSPPPSAGTGSASDERTGRGLPPPPPPPPPPRRGKSHAASTQQGQDSGSKPASVDSIDTSSCDSRPRTPPPTTPVNIGPPSVRRLATQEGDFVERLGREDETIDWPEDEAIDCRLTTTREDWLQSSLSGTSNCGKLVTPPRRNAVESNRPPSLASLDSTTDGSLRSCSASSEISLSSFSPDRSDQLETSLPVTPPRHLETTDDDEFGQGSPSSESSDTNLQNAILTQSNSETINAAVGPRRTAARQQYEPERGRKGRILARRDSKSCSPLRGTRNHSAVRRMSRSCSPPRGKVRDIDRYESFRGGVGHIQQERADVNTTGNQCVSSSLDDEISDAFVEEEFEVLVAPGVEGAPVSAAWHLHGRDKRVSHIRRNLDEDYGPRHAVKCAVMSPPDGSGLRVDVEEGYALLSGRTSAAQLNKHDKWSTGVAASIVAGTASRYHKTLFMFPHGRRILLPILTGCLACGLSISTLLSCRLMTILPSETLGGITQVIQVGPWRYLSMNSLAHGQVCLPYPSEMTLDGPFVAARACSSLAASLGMILVFWSMTLMCIPATAAHVHTLAASFVLNSTVQLATAALYQTDNCDGGGYFGGGTCQANQDIIFCAVSGLLFAVTGWELYINQRTALPGKEEMKVYTWSAEARSSDPDNGLVRTVEKSWTRLPNSSTLMATAFVERRREFTGDESRVKTEYSVQTQLIP